MEIGKKKKMCRKDNSTSALLFSKIGTIEHYLKVCAGKPDCREMKMNWDISISEQSGFPTYTPVLCSME